MAALKPDVSSLLRAGRTAFRPQASDRERVLQSLGQTLGASALLDGPRRTEPPQSPAGRFPVRTWTLGGLGALTVGAGVLVAAHSWTTAPSRPESPVATSIPAVEPVAPPPAAIAPRPSVEERPAQAAHASPSPGAPDSLPEEVRLLSKAEQQLSAGRDDDALRTLGEHERRFPGGVLAEERMAARVQALCALGRVTEAKADLVRLARAYPQSPHLDRARKFCGVDTSF
jgi:hypothetical protein